MASAFGVQATGESRKRGRQTSTNFLGLQILFLGTAIFLDGNGKNKNKGNMCNDVPWSSQLAKRQTNEPKSFRGSASSELAAYADNTLVGKLFVTWKIDCTIRNFWLRTQSRAIDLIDLGFCPKLPGPQQNPPRTSMHGVSSNKSAWDISSVVFFVFLVFCWLGCQVMLGNIDQYRKNFTTTLPSSETKKKHEKTVDEIFDDPWSIWLVSSGKDCQQFLTFSRWALNALKDSTKQHVKKKKKKKNICSRLSKSMATEGFCYCWAIWGPSLYPSDTGQNAGARGTRNSSNIYWSKRWGITHLETSEFSFSAWKMMCSKLEYNSNLNPNKHLTYTTLPIQWIRFSKAPAHLCKCTSCSTALQNCVLRFSYPVKWFCGPTLSLKWCIVPVVCQLLGAETTPHHGTMAPWQQHKVVVGAVELFIHLPKRLNW